MAEAQVAFLEAERTQSRAQLDDMERELQRRESVVAMLMEKDALRTAELEKMQRQEEAKRHKEAINVSAFEETPTSGTALPYLCDTLSDTHSDAFVLIHTYVRYCFCPIPSLSHLTPSSSNHYHRTHPTHRQYCVFDVNDLWMISATSVWRSTATATGEDYSP